MAEELDEQELFALEGDDELNEIEGSDSENDSEEAQSSSATGSLGGSGSQKSSTLNVVLEDEEQLDTPDWRHAAKSFKRAASKPVAMAQSLPVFSGQIKMGSSVPINIPFMGMRGPPGAKPEPGPALDQYPATFVPPHQLSQLDDFTFSVTGESPGNAMKRDRLRVRNAILQSTGFLEKNIHISSIVESVATVTATPPQYVSQLSQALHAVAPVAR